MSNESEEQVPEVSAGDLVNDQVARNMAESAAPPVPPPAATLPEKSPTSAPQADVYGSVSSSTAAASLPASQAYSPPTAAPVAPSGRSEVEPNADYFQNQESAVRNESQSPPVDLSSLLQAIEKLIEVVKELKPVPEKTPASGPEVASLPGQTERTLPTERPAPFLRNREEALANTDRVDWKSPREPDVPKSRQTWTDADKPESPRREMSQQQSVPLPRNPSQQSAISGPEQPGRQAPDVSQQSGKFQKEMQQFLASNMQALQQVLGVMEAVTSAVDQQNNRMAQMQAQLAQLTQFSSSTLQRSQKAGYR